MATCKTPQRQQSLVFSVVDHVTLREEMQPSDIASEFAAILKRLEALEEYRADDEASVDLTIMTQLRAFTRVQALEVVVMELAVELGVSEARVKQRLDEVQRRFHDQHLKEAERKNSQFAASIDDRKLDEVPTDEEVGRLFPPKGSVEGID